MCSNSDGSYPFSQEFTCRRSPPGTASGSSTRIGVRASRSCSAMAEHDRPMIGNSQLLFFLHHGYRVISHDRRGHGRSTQTADGHDMDHYADDLAALSPSSANSRSNAERYGVRRRRAAVISAKPTSSRSADVLYEPAGWRRPGKKRCSVNGWCDGRQASAALRRAPRPAAARTPTTVTFLNSANGDISIWWTQARSR